MLTKQDLIGALKGLATKADLKGMATKDDLKNEILATRTDLKKEIDGTRADLRNEIKESENRLRGEIAQVKVELRREIHDGVDLLRVLIEAQDKKMDQLIEGFEPQVNKVESHETTLKSNEKRITILEDVTKFTRR